MRLLRQTVLTETHLVLAIRRFDAFLFADLGLPCHLLRVDREAWSWLWLLVEDKRLRIGLERFGFLSDLTVLISNQPVLLDRLAILVSSLIFHRAHHVIDSKTLISRFFDL